jgi:hypothetical protein
MKKLASNVSNFWLVVVCTAFFSTGIMSEAREAEAAGITAFSPVLTPNLADTGNDGLFFTPNTAISVTALGYVDCGFSVGHDVGLYDVTTSTLLAETTVTISSTPSDGFYYNSISPLLLTAGNEYAVVGTQVPADSNWTASSVNPAPGITFNGYAYDFNSTLDLPTTPYGTAYFGPNFQFVPEPSTTSCLLMGVASLVCLRRFKTGRRI